MRIKSNPILLVEDDSVDAMTVKRALKELHVSNPLTHVENGEEALAHLQDASQEQPCLILLDLNMPVMNGIEFLHAVKSLPELKRIPVVALTTSDEQEDKVESFELGVAGYMRKPVEYQQFVEIVRAIDAYWTISESPL
ncbi:response regulator [Methylomonas sp. MED-D]|uniref:Two-component system response regulator n=1 Tax=Methylomonas koyamae TaxID=702114 RepID=A0A177NL69_9GAMM|nr:MULTISPECIES: response regulator [Methylomonas]MDT4329969.1 response regulator [Methylomonas sp. MV1]OAI18153.1 two-component system response regulator [Methylomonas koyamae]OHX36466.1 two-component system response regulator [Methylomonas sp. LWB]WGS86914.1 response regulator [Methylomonas sp. UP202]